MTMNERTTKAYGAAKERYAEIGVNVDQALKQLETISISLNCWQGDDVAGFETPDAELTGGGIAVTGNYPGRARNINELWADLNKACSLIPGDHRINLHAMYADFGGKFVDRDAIGQEHFASWVDWAASSGLKLDLNPTLFSHPKAQDYTLSHQDKAIRDFWIEHVKRTREISSFIGKKLGSPVIHNLWIPDGSKDIPVDRYAPRERLKSSLDSIYTGKMDHCKDALESKLFGLGSEAYVVGSHEFYLGYTLQHGLIPCMDLGHFHPTESIADKISAMLLYWEELHLHVSRGVRWDSDHVVILNDDVKALAQEIVRCNALERISISMDFFDGTINRVGAWVVGARATLKAHLMALLEPQSKLRELENSGRYLDRMAFVEALKSMPYGDIWNYYCLSKGVPNDQDFAAELSTYEKQVLSHRV